MIEFLQKVALPGVVRIVVVVDDEEEEEDNEDDDDDGRVVETPLSVNFNSCYKHSITRKTIFEQPKLQII